MKNSNIIALILLRMPGFGLSNKGQSLFSPEFSSCFLTKLEKLRKKGIVIMDLVLWNYMTEFADTLLNGREIVISESPQPHISASRKSMVVATLDEAINLAEHLREMDDERILVACGSHLTNEVLGKFDAVHVIGLPNVLPADAFLDSLGKEPFRINGMLEKDGVTYTTYANVSHVEV